MNIILREKGYPTGLKLSLIQGDITLAEAEAVVNPANAGLVHGGGLAGLLARRAGPALQAESRAWIREHGPVTHAAPAFTGAGDLPFRYIIHAVGPVWGSGKEDAKLEAAVLGSLELADRLGLASLAIPAISTGIFGYPLEQAAQVILGSLASYAGSQPDASLKSIQLIVFDEPAAETFRSVWDRQTA